MESVVVERAHPQRVLEAVVSGEIDLRVLDDLSWDDLARPGLVQARLGAIESAAFVTSEGGGLVGLLAVRSINERDRRAEVLYGCAFGADRDQIARSLLAYVDAVLSMFGLRTVFVSDVDDLLVSGTPDGPVRELMGSPVVRRVGTRCHRRWPQGVAFYQISRGAPPTDTSAPLSTVFRRRLEHDRSDGSVVEPERLRHPIAETLRTVLVPFEDGDLQYLRRMECEGTYLDRVRFSGRCPSPDAYRRGFDAADVVSVVIDRSSGRREGVIVLYSMDYFRSAARLAAILAPSSDRTGIAIEATAAMVEYAFSAFPIDHLEVEANGHTVDRFGSAASFGLTKAVQTVGTLWAGGAWVDEFLFAMSRSQFAQLQDRMRLLPDATSTDRRPAEGSDGGA